METPNNSIPCVIHAIDTVENTYYYKSDALSIFLCDINNKEMVNMFKIY